MRGVEYGALPLMVMGQLPVPYQNPAGLSAGFAPGAAATASAAAGRPVLAAGPALPARTKIDARARTDARAEATATRGRFIVLLAMRRRRVPRNRSGQYRTVIARVPSA